MVHSDWNEYLSYWIWVNSAALIHDCWLLTWIADFSTFASEFAIILFLGSLVFGLASSKAQSVLEKYGPIEKFPHILVATADGVKRYTGDIAIGALSSFLSEFAPASETPASGSQPEAAKPAPKPATPKPVVAWKDATQEANLDEYAFSAD